MTMLLWWAEASRDVVGLISGAYLMQDETIQTISEDEARGGVTGHNVRYVLGAGLAAVIVSFMVMAMVA
jgi:hypothetical protein